MGIKRYQLGPGDVVELRVYNDPTLTGKYTVDVDGNLDIPLVGTVPAKCRTDLEMKEEVLKGLKNRYLKIPRSASVDGVTAGRCHVFGGGARPTGPDESPRAPIELLAVAGGAPAGGRLRLSTEPTWSDRRKRSVSGGEKKTDDAIGVPFNFYNIAT